MSAPRDLTVAVLCMYGTRGRSDDALLAKLGGFARNGVIAHTVDMVKG